MPIPSKPYRKSSLSPSRGGALENNENNKERDDRLKDENEKQGKSLAEKTKPNATARLAEKNIAQRTVFETGQYIEGVRSSINLQDKVLSDANKNVNKIWRKLAANQDEFVSTSTVRAIARGFTSVEGANEAVLKNLLDIASLARAPTKFVAFSLGAESAAHQVGKVGAQSFFRRQIKEDGKHGDDLDAARRQSFTDELERCLKANEDPVSAFRQATASTIEYTLSEMWMEPDAENAHYANDNLREQSDLNHTFREQLKDYAARLRGGHVEEEQASQARWLRRDDRPETGPPLSPRRVRNPDEDGSSNLKESGKRLKETGAEEAWLSNARAQLARLNDELLRSDPVTIRPPEGNPDAAEIMTKGLSSSSPSSLRASQDGLPSYEQATTGSSLSSSQQPSGLSRKRARPDEDRNVSDDGAESTRLDKKPRPDDVKSKDDIGERSGEAAPSEAEASVSPLQADQANSSEIGQGEYTQADIDALNAIDVPAGQVSMEAEIVRGVEAALEFG